MSPLSANEPFLKEFWSDKHKRFRHKDVTVILPKNNFQELLFLKQQLLKAFPATRFVQEIKDLFEVTCTKKFYRLKLKMSDVKKFEEKKDKMLKEFPDTLDLLNKIIALFEIESQFKYQTKEMIINEAVTIFCNKHSKLKYKYENFKTLIKNCLDAYQKEKDERVKRQIDNERMRKKDMNEGIDIDFFRKENLKVFFYEQICSELKHINVLEKRNQMGDYTRVSLAIFLYFACTGKKLRANHEVTVRNLRLSAGSLSEFKKKT